MLANLWALIQFILGAIGFWRFWLSERDKEKAAKGQENTEARDKAVDEQVNAQTEDEFDKAQSDIAKHVPRP